MGVDSIPDLVSPSIKVLIRVLIDNSVKFVSYESIYSKNKVLFQLRGELGRYLDVASISIDYLNNIKIHYTPASNLSIINLPIKMLDNYLFLDKVSSILKDLEEEYPPSPKTFLK